MDVRIHPGLYVVVNHTPRDIRSIVVAVFYFVLLSRAVSCMSLA